MNASNTDMDSADNTDLQSEQAYIDHAYSHLDVARDRAVSAINAFRRSQGDIQQGDMGGGTEQARVEFSNMLDLALARLVRLEIGNRSLVFGRIKLSDTTTPNSDTDPSNTTAPNGDTTTPNGEDSHSSEHSHNDASHGEDSHSDASHSEDSHSFYIGRVGLWDNASNSVLVDWRAPIAEPFYRATGVHPLGLEHRRRFICRSKKLLGFEDEVFGAHPDISFGDSDTPTVGDTLTVVQSQTLANSIQSPRTGRLNDIVGTIQAEQDEIIRSPLPGVLVVQGGPGTGKTVVALHRAAYLLYTYRFPLENQGVLVVGPNRLFLAYIEQVLPSLGEAGVQLAVLEDIMQPGVRIRRIDSEDVARVKGSLQMARLLSEAVADRQRPLREDIVVGYGLQKLKLTVQKSAMIVAEARRRYRQHNAGRGYVEKAFFEALAQDALHDVSVERVRDYTEKQTEVRQALDWMWPTLTPEHLLQHLFGSKALLHSAAKKIIRAERDAKRGDDDANNNTARNNTTAEDNVKLSSQDINLLYRPDINLFYRTQDNETDPQDNETDKMNMRWSLEDVALLDEAQVLLGYTPTQKEQDTEQQEIPTYGHIVVDEAQDFSPMQLRMIRRRSLNGSMTVVGDIAQSTGAWAHENWDSILSLLPSRHQYKRAELTIGYRIPAPAMELANRVLSQAAPTVTPPVALSTTGETPHFVSLVTAANTYTDTSTEADTNTSTNTATDVNTSILLRSLLKVVATEREAIGEGNVAVIVPESLHITVRRYFMNNDVDFTVSRRHTLERQVVLVPVRLVKGIEVDSAIVVEPSRIIDETSFGLRSLYVALTRATKRIVIVHTEPLPQVLQADSGKPAHTDLPAHSHRTNQHAPA